MQIVKKLITVLLPSIIIIIYSVCFNWADHYASTHYDMSYKMLVSVLGNIVFGTFLFFVCKNGINSKKKDSPSIYVLAVIIIPLILLISVITALITPLFMSYAFNIIPHYFIFSSIYIGLFIYSLRKKREKKQTVN